MKRMFNRTRELVAPMWWGPLAVAFLLAGCDTEGLLEVDLPGDVTAEDVEDVGLASVMRDSAIGDFECVWDAYVAGSARHSDQYIQSSGNITQAMQNLRRIDGSLPTYATGSCASSYGLFTPLHTARVMLERHFDRLQGFTDEEVPSRQQYMAEMRVYSGFTYIAFGEGFCGTPLDGGEQILEPDELLQIAVDRFTEGLQIAEAAGHEQMVNAALTGRARANLTMERYQEVIQDAERVPEGFRFDATRDGSESRRYNKHESINRNETNRSASVAPSYRDIRWKGEPDPRVNVMNTGFIGHDNATIVWRHDKVNSRSDDVRIASWEEAQLFIAEAAALTGDLDRARSILSEFHERAGIPDVTEEDIPTQADVIRHVIQERKREFFVEGGHRLRDHLRWRGTEFEIPFLGEPGSDHPDGVAHTGEFYGSTTCYPVADVELTGTTG